MQMQPIQNLDKHETKQHKRLLAAAKEFESIFTSMMVKSMRKSVGKSDLLKNSFGEKIYTDMLDNEYSKIIANNASFGLAEKIVAQIESLDDKDHHLTMLKDIQNNPWMLDNRLVSPNVEYAPLSSSEQIAKYESIIDDAAEKYGVDCSLIKAVITQESAGNPYAVSHAGAKGLMQLIDSTAREVNVRNVFDPRDNIMGGTKYLCQMMSKFGGNTKLALAAYNAGPGAVKKYGGIPPYRETKNYVIRVTNLAESYRQNEINKNDGEK